MRGFFAIAIGLLVVLLTAGVFYANSTPPVQAQAEVQAGGGPFYGPWSFGGCIWIQTLAGTEECIAEGGQPDQRESDGKIVFIDPNNDLTIMNADGTNQEILFDSDNASQPNWSPDGFGIVFLGNDDNGQQQVYLTSYDPTGAPTELAQLSDDNSLKADPAWAPDGNSIVYNSNIGGDLDLLQIDLQRGETIRLLSMNGGQFAPVWSSDGSQIAFYSRSAGDGGEIWVLDMTSGETAQLTEEEPTAILGGETWFDWSPDGSQIAFVSDRDGNNEIYVMDADGSEQVRWTNNQSGEFAPHWSPDGRQIAFQTDRWFPDGPSILAITSQEEPYTIHLPIVQ